MILRHWPSACTWLCTVRIWSSRAPGIPIRWNRIRRKCSATMCSPESGRKWWMSATRPGDRVVDRDHRQVGLAALDRREHVLERRAGQRLQLRVVLAAHLVGVGARLALVGDASRFGHRSIVVWAAWAFLVVLSLVVALAALALAAAGCVVRRRRRRRRRAARGRASGCARRWPRSAPRRPGAIRHLGIVRYDAFASGGPSVGGRLSWSLALLDDRGDGVVLTAIHGRSEARSYAKSIAGWSCDQPMSPEEQEAVASGEAMSRAHGTGTSWPTSSASPRWPTATRRAGTTSSGRRPPAAR